MSNGIVQFHAVNLIRPLQTDSVESNFGRMFFFFFSSRRRHTRFDCDWSSDVCSSDLGVQGLTDRSRRPHRHANQLPMVVEKTIVRIKREYPSWGAPKIRERLRQRWPELHCPAISTVHAVLDRHGLVTRRTRRSRRRLTGTSLSWPATPNRLWCADYKGEFLLGNRRYCYPLTITDFASRYLLACEALSTTKERYAFTVFERAFQEFGLPEAIRTDNGVPFASAHALYGLSKLAVWWLRDRKSVV